MDLDGLNVADIMTREVVTSGPDEPLVDVVKQLTAKRFSCLVVVEDEVPVGIITERDLIEVLADTLQGVTWNELSIENFMTSPIMTFVEDMTLSEAILIAQTNNIRHIPVVDTEDKLAGILTQSNIIACL